MGNLACMPDEHESVSVETDRPRRDRDPDRTGQGKCDGPGVLLGELEGEKLDTDPDVRAIVLTGSACNFNYGLDIAAMGDALGPCHGRRRDRQAAPDFHARLKTMRTITAVADCRTTIAAVHGWLHQGSVDLISAVDIRNASADAKLSVRAR